MDENSNTNDLAEEACPFLGINTIYLDLYCSTYNVSIQKKKKSLVKKLRNQYNQTRDVHDIECIR